MSSPSEIVSLCCEFTILYRPHSAREDTALFPALHSILSVTKVAELGERLEHQEEKLFGEEGFLKIVDPLADIERQFGIYDLAKFTPLIPSGS